MLTNKDLGKIRVIVQEEIQQKIREIVRQELNLALQRTITIERGPEKQGDPEKVVREENWHILDFLCAYMPRLEGALRGMQEDVDQTKNRVAENTDRLVAVGNVLIGMEDQTRALVELTDVARGISEIEMKLIEGKKGRYAGDS